MPKRPLVGIGGTPLPQEQLSEADLDALANYKPSLTYGQAKQAPPEDFVPAHVAWDKKVCLYKIKMLHMLRKIVSVKTL